MKIIQRQSRPSDAAVMTAEAPKPKEEETPASVAAASPAASDVPPSITREVLNESLKIAIEELKASVFSELAQLKQAKPAESASIPAVDKLIADMGALRTALEESKTQIVDGLHQAEEKYALAQGKTDEQLRQNAQQILRLTEEIASLKKPEVGKPLAELQTPKAVEPIAPLVESPVLPEPNGLLDALAGPPRAAKDVHKKVAFTRKLWDYLNQSAFETPSRKSNQKP